MQSEDSKHAPAFVALVLTAGLGVMVAWGEVKQYLREQRGREVSASYDRAFGPDEGDDEAALRRAGARKALSDIEW